MKRKAEQAMNLHNNRVDPNPPLEPFKEPQPEKAFYLYVCEIQDANVAVGGDRTASMRRAKAADLERLGFEPAARHRALTERARKALVAADEYIADILDNYEGEPRKFGEIDGKHRLAELRLAFREAGYDEL
jgi:hypothetical protein